MKHNGKVSYKGSFVQGSSLKGTGTKAVHNMVGNIQLRKGCRIYTRYWPHGYLWIGEYYQQGNKVYIKAVDQNGLPVFEALEPGDVNHVGGDHSKCAGEEVLIHG